MAGIDLAAQNLMETILDESMRSFDGLKSATEQTIQKSTADVKKRFDDLVAEAASECRSIAESTDKENKKVLANTMKGYQQTVSDAEKDAIQTINNMWKTTKTKLTNVIEEAKTTLGKQVKELEKVLKEVTNYIEKVITDYIKLIHDYAKAAQNTLTDLNRQYLK